VRAAARELADAGRAALRFDLPALAGQVAGGGRALRLLPRYLRRGAPLVPLPELARFRVGSRG
jgi:hypothetical protein